MILQYINNLWTSLVMRKMMKSSKLQEKAFLYGFKKSSRENYETDKMKENDLTRVNTF